MWSPLGKDGKSKFVLGGSPASYKTMDSIENLRAPLPAYCVNPYGLKLLLPVAVEPCDVVTCQWCVR